MSHSWAPARWLFARPCRCYSYHLALQEVVSPKHLLTSRLLLLLLLQQADNNIRDLGVQELMVLTNARQSPLVVKCMNLDVMLPKHSKNQWFLASLAPLLNTGEPGNIHTGTRHSLKNDSCDVHEAPKHKRCVTSR
jgi:hypothetical protein